MLKETDEFSIKKKQCTRSWSHKPDLRPPLF